MFENTEMTEVVKQFLPVLFSTFLLRMGSTNGIETKSAFGRNPIEFESNIALLKLKNPSTILLFFLFFFFFFFSRDASKSFENLLTLLEDEEVLPVVKSAETKKKLGEAEFFDPLIEISRSASFFFFLFFSFSLLC